MPGFFVAGTGRNGVGYGEERRRFQGGTAQVPFYTLNLPHQNT